MGLQITRLSEDGKKAVVKKYNVPPSFSCSDGTQGYNSYRFTSSNIIHLVKLLCLLNHVKTKTIEIEDSNNLYIEFEDVQEGRLIFKLFRYFRTPEISKIVDIIIDAIDNGVAFQNAILLAHYSVKENPKYWAASRDLMNVGQSLAGNPRSGFYTYKKYLKRIKAHGFNSSFETAAVRKLKISHAEVHALVDAKNYKAAELLLTNYEQPADDKE